MQCNRIIGLKPDGWIHNYDHKLYTSRLSNWKYLFWNKPWCSGQIPSRLQLNRNKSTDRMWNSNDFLQRNSKDPDAFRLPKTVNVIQLSQITLINTLLSPRSPGQRSPPPTECRVLPHALTVYQETLQLIGSLIKLMNWLQVCAVDIFALHIHSKINVLLCVEFGPDLFLKISVTEALIRSLEF